MFKGHFSLYFDVVHPANDIRKNDNAMPQS